MAFGVVLFIDGERDSEWEWLLEHQKQDAGNAMVILLSGDVLAKIKDLGKRVYYDQGGVLSRRFDLQHTPTIVTQVNRQLQLQEVVV